MTFYSLISNGWMTEKTFLLRFAFIVILLLIVLGLKSVYYKCSISIDLIPTGRWRLTTVSPTKQESQSSQRIARQQWQFASAAICLLTSNRLLYVPIQRSWSSWALVSPYSISSWRCASCYYSSQSPATMRCPSDRHWKTTLTSVMVVASYQEED